MHRNIKKKIINWSRQNYKLFSSKDTQENEKASHGFGENICKTVSDKGLVSGVCKELLQFNKKRIQLKNEAKMGKRFEQTL